MSDNKHGFGWNGKGYYIALILCAAAIGITSYVYERNQRLSTQAQLQATQAVQTATLETGADVPATATQPPEPRVQQMPTQPQPTQPEKLRVTAPVAGEPVYGYSVQALCYNQTTRDWRVHAGVDFPAEAGTEVCAAAAGTVTAAYTDDLLGPTVEIRHQGGYTTRYSSLEKELKVAPGDPVQAGQVIGRAADTALVETALGSHLHFAVTSQGKTMDPMEFLALE